MPGHQGDHQPLGRAALAQTERLSYQRRGGPRQPGTRGGVFHEKISNGEGVLLALLYQRRLCTLDVLAGALGGVSTSAVGNVIRQTLPLLQHEDAIPGPAPSLPHNRRSPRRWSNERRDKLILYGFTTLRI